MKIALGTVQWGLDYGIANSDGIPSDTELQGIISIADEYGITLYDTAVHYGNAEKRVGQFVSIENKIITKIGAFSKVNPLEKQLEQSFKKLNRIKIYGCLFHNSEELLNNKSLWVDLLRFKQAGKIEKIGYSLYEPAIMLHLLEEGMIPDIVQLPYSILDRKFEPYFQLLKDKGVEIHVRSVFLQGLYLTPISSLDKKFDNLRNALIEIKNISNQSNCSILELVLNFVAQNVQIDYLILGVENKKQLHEIINAMKNLLPNKEIEKIKQITLNDPAILNPVNWS